jgi:hypothetical protein
MITPKNSFLVCASLSFGAALPSNAATNVSVSFWAYDQAAGNTPYYSHFSVTKNTDSNFWNGAGDPETVAIVNLFDSGWGFSTTVRSSYHVATTIDGIEDEHASLRSIGWHNYEFSFNVPTNAMTISMDGNIIQSGSYVGPLNWFSFNFNGHTQESVIDDFSIRFDGSTVYQQSFESAILDDGWVVSRQDAGGYVTSGYPSTAYSGSGALALGSNVAGIVFDLNSVPEPSSFFLVGLSATGLILRRKR